MHATSVLARRTPLVQFVVLKREDKWMVKSKELERVFSAQHKAVEAAIKLAHDSGKDGKPAVVLFQQSARAPAVIRNRLPANCRAT